MKYIKLIGLLLLVSFFQACEKDFLEPQPTSAISSEGYFLNDEQIETGVIGVYDALQGVNSTSLDDNRGVQQEFYVTEMRSDNTRTKSQEGEAAQFETYSVTANNGIVENYYRSAYSTIYRANLVLDNLGNASDAAAPRFEGEAKFARAYSYFNLVRLFGDVPLVDRIIGPLETDVAFTRVSTATVYELIISDLQTAAANLGNGDYSRASKAAAEALLAKVHLTLGNYLQAQMLCENVMGYGFGLEPNFNDVFYNEGNNEIIFAIVYNPGVEADSQDFSAEFMNGVGRTVGVNYVMENAAEFLDANGGDRTQYSYRIDPGQITQNQVVKYLPNGEDGGDDGRTFVLDATLSGNDWIVLRYSDVLLMHVESILAGGQDTGVSAALSSFQLVRDRAGLTDTVTNITKQELLDERRAELAFENQRLFDLLRFGEATNVLSALSAANGYTFSATDLLLPIPQREINLSNGVMTQNPGY
ncbi:RagB/SusD family nutrient uptake outer membrane protein [Ichthyenterobacterium sp. W332]|uniref:RagB/SusD family nutrient uptake outer membrane protein n=1 Tax=Microcosmobacter mediterraneus TaxID=3075607 RepID=A0ABU2YMM9_9FLAO|nr:RagB/SusD family nutrient uptake outer membrane protein [Ichthyenterobacterium sp. W332]MDT0558944.1 RagB/SusD family nutrient uptake outer membrane protein [Ichthyenterobacterium sp. W332]